MNEINLRDARHIITIEDPIEYEHQHRRSVVEQVEIGVDAPDFPTALRAALRQAPDVIVVGEMRDPETMRIAVTAGETGHLVYSSLHTSDVASTVGRVADSFPVERQNTIRQELSMALAAVLTQMLIPKPGGGRIPAAELLMVGYGARQHVRKNAVHGPAPGDHDHAEAGIIHPGGVARAPRARRTDRSGRGADPRGASGGTGAIACVMPSEESRRRKLVIPDTAFVRPCNRNEHRANGQSGASAQQLFLRGAGDDRQRNGHGDDRHDRPERRDEGRRGDAVRELRVSQSGGSPPTHRCRSRAAPGR